MFGYFVVFGWTTPIRAFVFTLISELALICTSSCIQSQFSLMNISSSEDFSQLAMVRGQKFSFHPDFKYFHFEADAISCQRPFQYFLPPPGQAGRPSRGDFVSQARAPGIQVNASNWKFWQDEIYWRCNFNS